MKRALVAIAAAAIVGTGVTAHQAPAQSPVTEPIAIRDMPCPRDAYRSIADYGLGEPPAGFSLDCRASLAADPGAVLPGQFVIKSTTTTDYYLLEYVQLWRA